MKRTFFSVRRALIAASVLFLMIALFSACKKDNDNVNIPTAGLMAFNLTPDKSSVAITLSGSLLTNSPLQYTNYTGGYLNIYPGDRSVKSYEFNKDSAFANSNFNFEAKKYYTLFVVGNNGTYKNVVAHDDIDSLSSTSGQAFVRYVNAIPDSSAPLVTITANGNNVVNSPSKFATVSGFTPVNAGDINVAVAGDNGISSNRTITLENGKIYTVLLTGVPAATDSLKAVQIKYVVNGQI